MTQQRKRLTKLSFCIADLFQLSQERTWGKVLPLQIPMSNLRRSSPHIAARRTGLANKNRVPAPSKRPQITAATVQCSTSFEEAATIETTIAWESLEHDQSLWLSVLPTASVIFNDGEQLTDSLRVLIKLWSEATFVTLDSIRRLGLKANRDNMTVAGHSGLTIY